MILLKAGQSATAEALRNEVTSNGELAAFKIPLASDIFFSTEPLPRGATGKTHKRTIKRNVLESLQRRSKL